MRLTESAKQTRRDGSKWIAPSVLHPWDRERKTVLWRTVLWRGNRSHRAMQLRRSCNPTGKEALDRDVNYFILQLERLGCKTLYSCGGHPNDFYVVFRASYSVARRISRCGYFVVSIGGHPDLFHLSHDFEKADNRANTPKPKLLRWAAMAWEEKFGPLRKNRRPS